MRSGDPSSRHADRASTRRRGTAFLLAVVAHALIVLLLLRLAPAPSPPPPSEPSFSMFEPSPLSPAAKTPEARTVAAKARRAAARPSATPPKPTAAPPPPPVPTPPTLFGDKSLFDAADISKLPSERADKGDEGDAKGAHGSADSASTYGPGEGPGGQRLYDAEWYREPTHAELAYYLPPDVPQNSWAMIACQTIANYHVENCRALSESPAGSGLARSLRQAAWQFRVLPPRIGGRRIMGAWVRIRIDWTEIKGG